MNKVADVIVIGAGFSGLCASYHLKKKGMEHIVFERGVTGESWHSQRWDNFRFNSTNELNLLPGTGDCDKPHFFGTAPDFVQTLKSYVSRYQLPVREHTQVIAVGKTGNHFSVKVLSGGVQEEHFSKRVLIASGAANETRIPKIAGSISKEIVQVHTIQYKNPDQLPQGAVLVVGGGQSGIQITEDLLDAGRKVYFSSSRVGRIPRWYRGRDIFYWIKDAGFYNVKADDVEPAQLDMRPPHVSGTGDGRTTVSLQSISKKGAVILGTLEKASASDLFFLNNAAEHVRFADDFSQQIKKLIDEYIQKNNLPAPDPHPDAEDLPDTKAGCASTIQSINLKKENITSLIWATGFDHDLGYIKSVVQNEKGVLLQKDGESVCPGLYFLGFPWLRTRKSPILFGIIEDAEYIVNKLCESLTSDLQSKISL